MRPSAVWCIEWNDWSDNIWTPLRDWHWSRELARIYLIREKSVARPSIRLRVRKYVRVEPSK